MTTQCPICGCSELAVFARRHTPYLDRKEFYEIAQCRDCGHGFALGRNDPEFLRQIYSSGFHETSQQAADNDVSPIRVNARARVEWLRGLGIGGRLLDIGAGTGVFVEAASAVFDAEGVELAPGVAAEATARGLRIRCGDFLSMDFPQKAYDIVTLWDVLASLQDPCAAMARCRSLVRDGGHVLMTLPMIDSVAARLLKRTWPLLIPPVNLHYFSRRSVARLANDNGLDMSSMSFPGKRVALNFLALKAGRSLGMHGLARGLARTVPSVSVRINTGDIACVRLQRRPGSAP